MEKQLKKYSMRYFLAMIMIMFSFILMAQSTSWNEYKLKEHWKTNGSDEIEGIYEQYLANENNAKYQLALIKTASGYNCIYLKGAPTNYAWRWSVGDIKAYLTSTATANLFKTAWYIQDKSIDNNVFLIFESSNLKVVFDDGGQLLFIKLYPTANDNISKSGNSLKLASGTGFGISSNGIIVTNYHVIDGAQSIKVRGIASDFNKTYKAKVLVSDKNNDLALIKIDDYGFTSLGTIPYTIKTGLAGVGENIFVLGYPLRATMGDEIKLTNGIVSSKSGFQGEINSYQISAPIQPGNSGGPLFDNQGNLIGIINAKHVGAENASYAIKASYLTNLIDLLPTSPKLQTINLLKGKTLTQQVGQVKNFVFIIETE